MSFERLETRISTPIGDVRLVPTSADHIHVTSVSAPFNNVRGVKLTISVHYHKWSDGRWHIGREDQITYERRRSLHTNRLDSLKDVSESARKRIEEVLDVVVNAFAEANPNILESACIQDLAYKLDSAQSDYDKARKTADEAAYKVNALQHALYNATGKWPKRKVEV
jgi:hypothetical protein